MSDQFTLLFVSLISVVAFTLLFFALRIQSNCLLAMSSAKTALETIGNENLSDQVKEVVARRESGRLFFQCVLITLKSIFCFLFAIMPMCLGRFFGFFSFKAFYEFSVTPVFWVFVSLVGGAVVLVRKYL